MGERMIERNARGAARALVDPHSESLERRADRLLAGLVADAPGVLLAIVLERGADGVLAARVRTDRSSADESGPRLCMTRGIVAFVLWARAYARLDTTARCEALSAQGNTTWAVQARGTTGRFVVAVLAQRTALPSTLLERSREALLAIERATPTR